VVTFGIILAFMMAVGGIALIILPLRLLKIKIMFSRFYDLQLIYKLLVSVGLLHFLLAFVLWCFAIYILGTIALRGGPDAIWGGSEIGMSLSFFGLVYLITELFILPVTSNYIHGKCKNH
jgi:hypothetical protein